MSAIEINNPQTNLEPGLIAPLWHTGLGIALILVLAIVAAFLPQVSSPKKTLFFTGYKELFYIAGLLVECIPLIFVYAGLYLRQTPLAVLIGKTWNDWRDRIRDISLGMGLIAGVVFLAWLTVYLFGSGERNPAESVLMPKTAVQFYFFFLFLVAGGVIEEIVFRGYFLQQLAFICKSQTAGILLQGLLFALAHLGEKAPWLCQKFLIGILFGYVASRRKSLMPTMVAHCGMNALAAIASSIF